MATGKVDKAITIKSYSVTTAANSYVSPWGAFVEQSVSTDANTYGYPVAATTKSGSANPANATISAGGGTIMIYSKSAATFDVLVMFVKETILT